ncbi:MAG: tyrosine--tRNA ligase [Firmicutes bacterium HGW-Firmicutes-7]|nr:MAG: tyrosine--tRNA ligase [Firmicutes bacterium HGW-Firmicutes-7]
MKSAYDILLERGFIEQTTHEEEIIDLFKKEKITFYIGFDPTADSLTVGHFLTVMAMAHLQQAGHRPIVLIGGGTTMVGDPTGKSDMRKMMTKEIIGNNAESFKKQLSKFIDFTDDRAIMVNNADWLLNLNYVEFIREIGVHFSVNRMLTADCYKTRYEKGLTFLEFNYMLMQSYDFLELNKRYACTMQLGGNDQWSNILGGVELIRRKEGKPAYGMTFKLLTTGDGKKMGKTEKGAVWLDPEKTSPYEFYQYWRNTEDVKVAECLGLLTFLPMDEVLKLSALEGAEINTAKEVLAFEITKNIHGEEEALKAMNAAKALFSGAALGGSIPTTELKKDEFKDGLDILTLLQQTGLIPTRSEGRRLVEQGGIRMNDVQVQNINMMVTQKDFDEKDELMIKKGKKGFHRVHIS